MSAPTSSFEMDALTGKVTPVSLDTLLLKDSAAANELKEITFGNLETAILSGAIISINSDTTAAQIIAAGTGLGIVDAGATHTLSIDSTVATLTGVQTLENKTLLIPIIADFTNMIHDHADSAGGGQLTDTAIAIGAEIDVAKLADGAAGQFLRTDSAGTDVEWADDIASITFVIDGGGSVLSTGVAGDLEIPFNCTIERVTLLADQMGDVEIDLFVDTFANYPPVVGDSIVATAPPTITTDDNSQDTTLTGWITALASGSTIRYNVNSVTTITRVTIALLVRKTA